MLNSPPPATVKDLPEHFQVLLRQRGLDAATPVIPLKDGGNNQVYRLPGPTAIEPQNPPKQVSTPSPPDEGGGRGPGRGGADFPNVHGEGRDEGALHSTAAHPAPVTGYVLKRYFQDPADPRDRFNTERAFYHLLWNGGVRQIPEPCAWDQPNRLGLFTFAPGRKLDPREITRERVSEAAQFILQINTLRAHPAARAVAAASEARFSLAEQIEGIASRVALLQQIAPDSELDHQALAFARDELRPAWERVTAKIATQCASHRELNDTLDASQRCLSPSDFGFHNALYADGPGNLGDARWCYIDFEYAGWDDPAKLICDFFCQPQVPVPFEFWDDFTDQIAAGLSDNTNLPLRAKVLLPAYQIKWCCIILNHFLTAGKARREFARGASSETARKLQLEKARKLLARKWNKAKD